MSTLAVTCNGRIRIPLDLLNLPQFLEWANSDSFPKLFWSERICYIDGNIEVDLNSWEEGWHSSAIYCIRDGLRKLAGQNGLGEVLQENVRIVNTEAGLATNPDLAYCSSTSWQYGLARYRPIRDDMYEVDGTPDLVVEVVSHSTADRDLIRLRKAYFDAGISEYWIVDVRGGLLTLNLLSRGLDNFEPAPRDGQGYRYSTVFGRKFQLARYRDRNQNADSISLRLRHRR